MADEIQVVQQIKVNNGLSTTFPQSAGRKADQTVIGGPTPGYLTVGTTEESISFPELTHVGWVILQNLDETNSIDWGFSSGVYGGRMDPGACAGPFKLLSGTTLYVKADGGDCKAYIAGYEQ